MKYVLKSIDSPFGPISTIDSNMILHTMRPEQNSPQIYKAYKWYSSPPEQNARIAQIIFGGGGVDVGYGGRVLYKYI